MIPALVNTIPAFKIPTQQHANLSKLYSRIFQDGPGNHEFSIDRAGSVLVGFRLESEEPLTLYDAYVLDAIDTIYQTGQSKITPTMIFQTMNGSAAQRLTEKKCEELEDSISRLRNAVVSLDVSQEFLDKEIKNGFFVDNHWTDSNNGQSPESNNEFGVVMCRKILDATANVAILQNHRQTWAYAIQSRSILHQYADLIGQVVNFQTEALQVRDLPCTTENVLMTQFIIRRVLQMQRTTKVGRVLSYEWKDEHSGKMKGLFPAIGITEETFGSRDAWLKKRRQMHKNITLVVQHLKEQKMIVSFAEKTEGKQIMGFNLECKTKRRRRKK